MTSLAPHVEAFLRKRLPLERGASPQTCETYAYALQLLVVFAAKRLNCSPSQLGLEQLDEPLILAFLEHLETERGNTARSRNARLAALKSFMRFLEHRVPSALEQIRRVLAIPSKKTNSRLVGSLSPDETKALLDAPDPTSRLGLRDRAMLDLAFAAGLRVSELVGLDIADLSLQAARPFIKVHGKGNKERELPLWKQTADALRAWLAVRGEPLAGAVFLNAKGDRMTRSGFEYLVDKYVAIAETSCPSLKGKPVSPHVLRHTCAMNLLHATHDIRKVSLWLGHSSIQTTEVYTHADPSEKLDTLNAAIPPNLRPGHFRPPDHLLALLKASSTSQDYAESSSAPLRRQPDTNLG